MLEEISPPNENLWSHWDCIIHYENTLQQQREEEREKVDEQTTVQLAMLNWAAKHFIEMTDSKIDIHQTKYQRIRLQHSKQIRCHDSTKPLFRLK